MISGKIQTLDGAASEHNHVYKLCTIQNFVIRDHTWREFLASLTERSAFFHNYPHELDFQLDLYMML